MRHRGPKGHSRLLLDRSSEACGAGCDGEADPFADRHRELLDQLDERVRALVRSEGVDPQRDAGVVCRIAVTFSLRVVGLGARPF
jgi:hypothetical protein